MARDIFAGYLTTSEFHAFEMQYHVQPKILTG
jgi:hypothetical protein